MILTHDIEKVVKNALDAQAVFAGRSHPSRGPDDPGYPYVVFSCRVDRTEYTSGPAYYQWWRVRAAAYAPLGGAAAVLDVLKGLAAALAAGVPPAAPPVLTGLRNPGEAVEGVMVKDTSEDYADSLRDGQDVLVATLDVELQCKGDKSLP